MSGERGKPSAGEASGVGVVCDCIGKTEVNTRAACEAGNVFAAIPALQSRSQSLIAPYNFTELIFDSRIWNVSAVYPTSSACSVALSGRDNALWRGSVKFRKSTMRITRAPPNCDRKAYYVSSQ